MINDCCYCGKPTEDEYIFTCPRCGRDGCPDCMPAGKNCICPECEEEYEENEEEVKQ